MTATEQELKLALPETELLRLRRLKRLGGPAGTATALHTVYFDTPGGDLARSGISLRVRHQGRSRVHCVKLPGHTVAGLAIRREWEVEAEDDQPRLDAFPPGTVDLHLDIAVLAETVAPVFTTEVRRVARRLREGDSEIEIAFDSGRIVTPAGTELPLSEIELELKGGPVAPLFDLALAVAELAPSARPLVLSKAARGWRLASGRGAEPVKAGRLVLAPEATVSEAFAGIIADCVGQWLGNLEIVLETDDPEGIHQMRVALRRLRSGFRVFRPVLGPQPASALADGLRWLAGALGPARDWDVFCHEVAGPAFAAAGSDPRLDAVMDQAQAAAATARDTARDAVADPKATRLALELGRFAVSAGWREGGDEAVLSGSARAFAATVIERQHRKVRRMGRRIATADAEALHGLRIQVKRLRYAVEFFGSLYPSKAVKRMLTAAATLQDDLGQLNDLVVARALVGGLGRADSRRAFAEGILVGALAGDVERSRRTLKRRWADFIVEDRFWH